MNKILKGQFNKFIIISGGSINSGLFNHETLSGHSNLVSMSLIKHIVILLGQGIWDSFNY